MIFKLVKCSVFIGNFRRTIPLLLDWFGNESEAIKSWIITELFFNYNRKHKFVENNKSLICYFNELVGYLAFILANELFCIPVFKMCMLDDH